jgi:hypothetical protein
MAVFQRNWRLVALISSCSLVAALSFALAQDQSGVTPKPVSNSPASTGDKPAVDKTPEAPRLSSLPPDFGAIHQRQNPFKGSTLGGENLEHERAAAFARVVAQEEAASLPSPLPLPIQVADEVVMITEQLRSLARNLDRVAADEEDEGNYKRADQLRKTAAKLRREARTLRTASADRRSPAVPGGLLKPSGL